jgi:hypothetical protein
MNVTIQKLNSLWHLIVSLHDRIPNRGARCDHPLDQSCSNAGRDRLDAIEAELERRGVEL